MGMGAFTLSTSVCRTSTETGIREAANDIDTSSTFSSHFIFHFSLFLFYGVLLTTFEGDLRGPDTRSGTIENSQIQLQLSSHFFLGLQVSAPLGFMW